MSDELVWERLSNHAVSRTKQRGARVAEVSLVLKESDRETPVGSGCTALLVSRERRAELISEGYPPYVVDRAIGLAVVESPAGKIVTVFRPSGRRGRRYRKHYRSHRAPCVRIFSDAA
jgi:hypothetical protein